MFETTEISILDTSKTLFRGMPAFIELDLCLERLNIYNSINLLNQN